MYLYILVHFSMWILSLGSTLTSSTGRDVMRLHTSRGPLLPQGKPSVPSSSGKYVYSETCFASPIKMETDRKRENPGFPKGGANLLFGEHFTENCMQMKEL